jgi:hypothetical protein
MTCPLVTQVKPHHRARPSVPSGPGRRHDFDRIFWPITYTNTTSGAEDKPNPTRNSHIEAPLTGVLALAATQVPADRTNLSEGQPL